MNIDNLLKQIRIVLVDTRHPGNIGGAARAMKNMGLTDLYLVQPKHFPDPKASARAAGAIDVLEAATVVDTLPDAIDDCSLVIGSSARQRRIPWPLLTARDCATQVRQALNNNRVAIVFGREDRGLTNEELHTCHLHVHIPSNEQYGALNLAMAVQVICYELRIACLAEPQGNDTMKGWDMPLATAEELQRYFTHLEETLTAIGFLNPVAPKQLMTRLRRLYLRAQLDSMEVSLLRGILSATQGTNMK
jgi:tRNA (cytidine32/uridine32-2'-O)-methyltransferase